MNERNRTLLQWVLGVGVAVASVKVIYDFTRPAPVFVEPEKTSTAPSTSASASESAVQLALPKGPRPPSAHPQPTGNPAAASSNGAAPAASGSASPEQIAQLASTLAAIAADPKGNQPLQAQRDPQTGLIILVYQVPGTTESVLALVPGQQTAWAWQLSTDLTPAQLAGAGAKLDKGPPQKQPGASASKIVGGPLDGAVVVTVSDRPDLRIVKSPAFQELEAQAQAAGPGGGGAPGNPRRHP